VNELNQMSLLTQAEASQSEADAKRRAIADRCKTVEQALRVIGIEPDTAPGKIARLIARTSGTAAFVKTKKQISKDKDVGLSVSTIKKAIKQLGDIGIIQRGIMRPIDSMKCEAVSLTLNMKLILDLVANDYTKRPDSVCLPITSNIIPPVTTPGNDRESNWGNSPGNDRGNFSASIRNNPDTHKPNNPNHHNYHEPNISEETIESELKTVVVVDDLESVKSSWGRMLQATPPQQRRENTERLWHVAWLSSEFHDTEMVESFIRASKGNGIKTSFAGYIEGIRRKACEMRGLEWIRDKLPSCPSVPPVPNVGTRVLNPIAIREKMEREVLAEWKSQRRFDFSDAELNAEIDRRLKSMTAEAVA
jgi:hypothetical protein